MKTQQRIICIFLFFIAFASCAKSQNYTMGLTANLGLSNIAKSDNLLSSFKVNYSWSGSLGGFIEKKIGQNSFIGVELLWVQIEARESRNNAYVYPKAGLAIKEVSVLFDELKFHSSYLGIPIYYRIPYKKLYIKPGFQTMIFLFASAEENRLGIINRLPYETEKSESGEWKLLDFGPKIGLDYLLQSNLRIRMDYYLGISNIILGPTNSFKRSNRQATLGINYIFSSTKKKR